MAKKKIYLFYPVDKNEIEELTGKEVIPTCVKAESLEDAYKDINGRNPNFNLYSRRTGTYEGIRSEATHIDPKEVQ